MNDLEALVSDTPGAALLLAAMLAASLIGLFRAPSMIERNLFRPHWLVPRREYATLVTSGFLHADLAHLLFNAFTFWAFGFGLERTIGTPAFLALYFVGLFVSDAGTWVAHHHDPDYRSLGASGAILAVLFASIVYHPSSSIFILPIPWPIPAPLFALGYLAYTLWAARAARGRINHDAHLAGALAGLAFVAVTDWPTLMRALRTFVG
ncbi:MAG: rhomboid family intramembrane serine protease [Burkholderiaceae bacterium]